MGFWQTYFSARGRVTRQQWWLRFVLPFLVIFLLLAYVDATMGNHYSWTHTAIENGTTTTTNTWKISIDLELSSLFVLAAMIPAFLVSIKRWHDRDKSGWWMLILLIPYVGVIWLLVELGFLRGTDGPNRFGPPAQPPFTAPAWLGEKHSLQHRIMKFDSQSGETVGNY